MLLNTCEINLSAMKKEEYYHKTDDDQFLRKIFLNSRYGGPYQVGTVIGRNYLYALGEARFDLFEFSLNIFYDV